MTTQQPTAEQVNRLAELNREITVAEHTLGIPTYPATLPAWATADDAAGVIARLERKLAARRREVRRHERGEAGR